MKKKEKTRYFVQPLSAEANKKITDIIIQRGEELLLEEDSVEIKSRKKGGKSDTPTILISVSTKDFIEKSTSELTKNKDYMMYTESQYSSLRKTPSKRKLMENKKPLTKEEKEKTFKNFKETIH